MEKTRRFNLNTCSWTIFNALCLLQATSQIGVFCIGVLKIASPLTFIDLIRNGFVTETVIGFSSSLLIGLSIYGVLKKGFARYLSLIFIGVISSMIFVLILGFMGFAEIFLDGFQGFGDLLDIFVHRYQEPEIWHHLLQTEAVVFSIFTVLAGYLIFERLRPAHKVLGNAHFANGFEIQRAGFFKREETK